MTLRLSQNGQKIGIYHFGKSKTGTFQAKHFYLTPLSADFAIFYKDAVP